jgi:cobalt-zinc-cadmium efflux system protein
VQPSGKTLIAAVSVTAAFVVLETYAGFYGNSLALLSDAAHNFSDVLALAFAGYAFWIAKRPADAKKTFGYHRVAILTALFNASTLILFSVAILTDAVQRLHHPVPSDPGIMLVVSMIAVILNGAVALSLHRSAQSDLNSRAAYIHMAGDAACALAVVVASLIYRYCRFDSIDSIVSILIAIFIFFSSWGIVKEATDILLESTPKGVNIDELVAAMSEAPYVRSVHDLHVWTMSDGFYCLSCHVEVDQSCTMEQVEETTVTLNNTLSSLFGIEHATIQTERTGACAMIAEDDSLFCRRPDEGHNHNHDHA